jgi:hypothetical protein
MMRLCPFDRAKCPHAGGLRFASQFQLDPTLPGYHYAQSDVELVSTSTPLLLVYSIDYLPFWDHPTIILHVGPAFSKRQTLSDRSSFHFRAV